MNAKDMEALIIAQGAAIQAAQEAHMHIVQRIDNVVEGFKAELAGRDEAFQEHRALMLGGLGEINQCIANLQGWIGADETDGPFHPEFRALTARIAQLETLVLARNSSAATKRNMTDEDAMRVLTGDVKDLSHKDAAEKIGLTYAQVYSCRLEFTFKHVHKDLRDKGVDNQPWKNNWVK